MNDDGYRESVIARLRALEDGQRNLSDRMVAAETNSAVAEVHHNNVEKRLTGIEDTLKWLVRLIIGAMLLAVMGYALQGGFNIG